MMFFWEIVLDQQNEISKDIKMEFEQLKSKFEEQLKNLEEKEKEKKESEINSELEKKKCLISVTIKTITLKILKKF